MGFRTDGLPAQVLAHLAENGPTEREVINDFMHARGTEKNGHVAISRLREQGLIKTKVWLTPEGLAELKRLGWEPQIAGVAAE